MKPITRQQEGRLRDLLSTEEAQVRAALAREAMEHSIKSSELSMPVAAEEGRARQVLDEHLATTRHLMSEFAAVAQARLRLDSHSYGVCVDCQRDIGFSSLVACPTAERCEDCQLLHERTGGERLL